MHLIAVFIGGGLGSVLRWLVGLAGKAWFGLSFPAGTLAANIVGSALLAFLARAGLEEREMSASVRLALTTGLCGGFTTYSTFNLETLEMLEDGHLVRGALYLGLTLVGCALGALAGFWLGHRLAP